MLGAHAWTELLRAINYVKLNSGGTVAGDLPGGRTINLHAGSSVGGAPTIEILDRATGTSIKYVIRSERWKD
jgi:hypothetical protein